MTEFLVHLPIMILALFIGSFVMPAVLDVSLRSRIFDRPDQRKWHKEPTPATGGVGILLTLGITLLIAPSGRQLLAAEPTICLGYMALTLIGVLDDRFHLSAILRLAVQIALALLITWNGTIITHGAGILGVQELSPVMQFVLTVVIVVGLTNAYNMVDGIDGLAGTQGIVSLGLFAAIILWMGSGEMLPVIMALMGTLVIFLRLNWSPARIFMGDGGSLPIGFLLAVIGVHLAMHATQLSMSNHALVIELLSGIFIGNVVDTLRVFINRMRQGRSPFSADRDHLHHWFLKNLRTHSQAVITMIALQAGVLAITILLHGTMGPSWIILIQGGIYIVVIRMLHFAYDLRCSYRMVRTMERAN
jgi:UDP-GlcNAc:undecaprenyl-phosphate/decaprenyl-phosphate GlcNAc-1-phosphate transferase